MIDGTVASADGIFAITLGTREGNASWTEHPDTSLVDVACCVFLIDAPVVVVLAAQSVGSIGSRRRRCHLAQVVGIGTEIDVVLLCRCCRCPGQGDVTAFGISVYIVVDGVGFLCRLRVVCHVEEQSVDDECRRGVGYAALRCGDVGDDDILAALCRELYVRLSRLGNRHDAVRLRDTRYRLYTVDIDIQLRTRHVGIRLVVESLQRVLARREVADGEVHLHGSRRYIGMVVAIDEYTVAEQF